MRYGMLNQGHRRQQREHTFSFKPRRKHRRIQDHDLDGLIDHLQDRLQVATLREAGPALQELHAGRASNGSANTGRTATDQGTPLNERLDALEQRLSGGLEVLSQLRAPLAELNAVLDDRQHETLEHWFAQRR
jgi:uncharacterized coiled-coil protein SlyX